jgi:hypothetical protein
MPSRSCGTLYRVPESNESSGVPVARYGFSITRGTGDRSAVQERAPGRGGIVGDVGRPGIRSIVLDVPAVCRVELVQGPRLGSPSDVATWMTWSRGSISGWCIRYQDTPAEDDRSMSLTELRLALGVTEALLNEALWLLTFPGDKRIMYPIPGRVALGPEWRGRCERQSGGSVTCNE